MSEFAIILAMVGLGLSVLNSAAILALIRVVGSPRTRQSSGRPAPSFSGTDLTGEPVSSDDLYGGLMALLFVSPSCPNCITTLAETHALQHKSRDSITVICRGSRSECSSLAADYGTKVRVLVDEDMSISRAFGITTVPAAVLVGSDRTIRSVGAPLRGDLDALNPSPA